MGAEEHKRLIVKSLQGCKEVTAEIVTGEEVACVAVIDSQGRLTLFSNPALLSQLDGELII
jgi:hypothetical protein